VASLFLHFSENQKSMKTLLAILCSLFLFALPLKAGAQRDQGTGEKVKSGVKKGYKGAKKGVKKGAHEVAEQASELKSEVTDREAEGKMGANGEDIYISDDGRYYYKDHKGRRVYVNASDLKNRPTKKDDD